jgi:hypothetical protein
MNIIMFNTHYPRRYLPRNNKIYLSPDGVTEIEGSGYKEPRKLWQTVIDPFDIRWLINGCGRQGERFWQMEESGIIQQTNATSKESETAWACAKLIRTLIFIIVLLVSYSVTNTSLASPPSFYVHGSLMDGKQ